MYKGQPGRDASRLVANVTPSTGLQPARRRELGRDTVEVTSHTAPHRTLGLRQVHDLQNDAVQLLPVSRGWCGYTLD